MYIYIYVYVYVYIIIIINAGLKSFTKSLKVFAIYALNPKNFIPSCRPGKLPYVDQNIAIYDNNSTFLSQCYL